MEILACIILSCIILAGLSYLIWRWIGDAVIDFRLDNHAPFILAKKTSDKAVFTAEFEVANTGKQCATIMDCFVRQQLPYEQFDGVRVKGKAELVGAPRPDDYFEAVLIQKGETIKLKVFIELSCAKSQGLLEAVKDIVDIPVDVIYQHTGRHIATLSKKRLILPASKIAALLQTEHR